MEDSYLDVNFRIKELDGGDGQSEVGASHRGTIIGKRAEEAESLEI
jgi:hypothetical protein